MQRIVRQIYTMLKKRTKLYIKGGQQVQCFYMIENKIIFWFLLINMIIAVLTECAKTMSLVK